MLLREAPVQVPIFSRGTESLRQTVSRFLMTKLRRRQNLWNNLCRSSFVLTLFIFKAPNYVLNPDLYKIFLTESWTNCISLREQWNQVRALRNQSETRWNKVRALRNHSEEGVGCRQPTEPQWTVITFTVWAVDDHPLLQHTILQRVHNLSLNVFVIQK